MNTKKKWLAALAAMIMTAAAFAADFPWYLNVNGTKITGCQYDFLPAKFVIPEGITEIGNDAFKGCTSLASVTYTGAMEQVKNRWTTVYGNMALKSGTLIHCADGDLRTY